MDAANTPHTEIPGRILDAGLRSAADTRGRVEVLTEREVLRLVTTARVGRIGFVVDGWPVVLPVNFTLDGRDVVFRTDPGAKLDASRAGRVCFEVDSTDTVYQRGWSALALGLAERVDDPQELERLERMRLRPWARGERRNWVRIGVQQWSGRRLPRAWRYPMSPP